METITLDIVAWIESLPLVNLYLVLVALAYLENVIPPIPGDILIVFAGYLAADGFINFSLTLGLTTFASVLGFMTMYAVGYRWGDGIRDKRSRFWMFKYLDYKYMTRVQGWMRRWGQGVIIANRFLAGTRSVISLIAGISQTPLSRTIASATLSSVLWNFVLMGAGWLIKENWERIGHYLSIYSWVVLGLILLFIAFRFFVYRKWKKNAQKIKTK
jgi:membrane protein DedA with SNARE-associated domain